MNTCNCTDWIQRIEMPGKVIILICPKCKTEYTLYPNGQIAYEIPASHVLSFGGAGERTT